MSVQVTAIWAQARGGIIGRDGAIPWHIPEDMAFFKNATMGKPVVMGRLTWESLPARFRPLPGRRNIVVTRNPGFVADGADVVGSVDDALAAAAGADEVVIMGGGQIYAHAMPVATKLIVTEIDLDVDGDTVAPTIGADWTATEVTEWTESASGPRLRWVTYTRTSGAASVE